MSTHVEQPAEGRGALAPGPSADPADQAALDKLEEACRSEEVKAAMEAERLRSQQRIAAVWAELETECLRIWHEVMLHRQKVMDDLFDKWCKVLTG